MVINTIPHDIITTTTVLIAVARLELTPSIPTLARIDVSAAKDLADRLSDKLGQSVIVLAIVSDKVVFVVKSKVKEVNAGQIAKMAAMITLGNGGGRPDFAQAGGKDVTKVDEALQTVKEELNKLL